MKPVLSSAHLLARLQCNAKDPAFLGVVLLTSFFANSCWHSRKPLGRNTRHCRTKTVHGAVRLYCSWLRRQLNCGCICRRFPCRKIDQHTRERRWRRLTWRCHGRRQWGQRWQREQYQVKKHFHKIQSCRRCYDSGLRTKEFVVMTAVYVRNNRCPRDGDDSLFVTSFNVARFSCMRSMARDLSAFALSTEATSAAKLQVRLTKCGWNTRRKITR